MFDRDDILVIHDMRPVDDFEEGEDEIIRGLRIPTVVRDDGAVFLSEYALRPIIAGYLSPDDLAVLKTALDGLATSLETIRRLRAELAQMREALAHALPPSGPQSVH